ncbi:MAG: prolyl oligopeptidase family serine peptidase [Verrucomicrobia bacterium]|nr:prolyl oligopeptidase family serine peptidase [Verrucomicrobiota bacterium]
MQSLWWTDLAQQPPPNREPFDNLGDMLQFFVEAQRSLAFDLSFTQPRFADCSAWRKESLVQLKQKLVLPARNQASEARMLRRLENDGYLHEEIEFESRPGLRVPATVLVPTRGQPPFPAIIVLHDMGGFRTYGREKMLAFDGEPACLTEHRKICYAGRSVMRDLVLRGYVVIAIDALLFGERTPQAQKDFTAFDQLRRAFKTVQEQNEQFSVPISYHAERAAASYAILTNQTWAGMIAHDDLATLDYLCARPEVDANRIGCVGLSFGAYRTNYLAAIEERIRAAVSVCWTATLDALIGYNVGGAMGAFTLIPGLHARMDLPDIQSLACPRALLAISGWNDRLMQPFGIARAHQKLRAVYEKAGVPEKLGSLVLDAPHEFNLAMQARAFEWMDKHLK